MLFPKTAMLQEAANRPGYGWALESVMFLAVWGICQIAVSIPVAIAGACTALAGRPISAAVLSNLLLLVQLYATVCITAIAVLFCHFLQKRRISSLGFRGRHAPLEYLLGGLIGGALFAAAVGICFLLGSVRVEAASGQVPAAEWLLFLLGFAVQGMSEEVLCRGYLMPSIARRNPVWLAVVLNSLLFSLLHLFNPGITALALLNIFLFGMLASVYVLRRGNLWGACAMHGIWNFVQGNVFGVQVSGIGNGSSLLQTTATGPALWNGGAFGLEGGLAVTLVLTAGLLAALFLLPDSAGKAFRRSQIRQA